MKDILLDIILMTGMAVVLVKEKVAILMLCGCLMILELFRLHTELVGTIKSQNILTPMNDIHTIMKPQMTPQVIAMFQMLKNM